MNDYSKTRYKYIAFSGNKAYRRYIQEDEILLLKEPINYNPQHTSNHGSYGALLFDERWKAKRKEILIRDNHSCAVCKSSSNLQVHHRQYHYDVAKQQLNAPWEYESYLLITLCESCHKRGHNIYKVPTFNI